jgi:hypothetical protein
MFLASRFPYRYCLIVILLFVGKVSAGENPYGNQGQITHQGLIDCFEEGLSSSEGEPVFCEASAIVFEGRQLIIASDKPIPGAGRSAVFAYPYLGCGAIEGAVSYLDNPPFVSAIKYEDMTITIDGGWIIATTGFDRLKSDSHEWDGYNTVLYWPVEDPDAVKVVSPSSAGGVTSSIGLRKGISNALLSEEFPDEVPYFKVESLAAIPGNRLLFGIRELGVRYDQFVYTFKILSVDYQIVGDDLVLAEEFELAYDFDSEGQTLFQKDTALSSIEYDPFHERLYLLTSFETGETDEDLGGYLWTLPLSEMKSGNAPSIVLKENGEALSFAHKAEGITVLGEHELMVIHDDDRVLGREEVENPLTQFSRGAHQAAYTRVVMESNHAHKKLSPELKN